MLRVSYLNSGWHTVIHITVFLARDELLPIAPVLPAPCILIVGATVALAPATVWDLNR